MKTHTPHILIALIIGILVAVPVHAAQISASIPQSSVAPNAPFTIGVSVTTDAAKVNVIQGAIAIPSGVTVDQVSTAGSSFSLWPTTPKYVVATHEVVFFGGTPYGIPANTTASLFTIRAHADSGAYTFTPTSVQAYEDDGKGTADAVTTVPVTVTVRPGAAASGVVAPGQAQPLVATIGRDATLFGGKYFITFYGGDRGAGVLTYEVREGSGSFVSADRYFVLNDQTLSKMVTVRAIDSDGVAAEVTVAATHPPQHSFIGWVVAVVIVVLLIVSGYIYVQRKNKKV